MKYFLIALLIVIIAGYFYVKKVLDSFTFGDVKFVGADIKSILSGGTLAAINLSSTIENKNSFSVPVNGLYIELYHQGKLIGRSIAPQADFTIPSMGSFTISQSMTVDISGALSIAAGLLQGAPITFDYIIKAKLFRFFPLTYKGNFSYQV